MRIVCMVVMLMAMPLLAQAEIYKWKDSNGVTRYSDTPPADAKAESFKAKKVASPPPAPVAAKDEGMSREAAAIKRQEDAEVKKKDDERKEAEAKLKKENCLAAKDTLNGYTSGAGMYKLNDKGEREYVSDADRPKAMENARKDVAKYCN